MMEQAKLLSRVRAFVERGERVSSRDCEGLFGVSDLVELARLARVPRERRHGRNAYFSASSVIDWDGQHIDGLKMALESTATAMVRVGRLDQPTLDELQRVARNRRVQILVAPSVVDAAARSLGLSVVECAHALAACGTVLLSAEPPRFGQGAGSQDVVWDGLSSEVWLDVHRAAHGAGIASVAAMPYGAVDCPGEYAEFLEMMRGLQDETTGFVAFVPLALRSRGADKSFRSAPTALQTLRAVACSRVYLDNVPHVGVPVALLGLEIAVIALSYGADTVDTTTRARDFDVAAKNHDPPFAHALELPIAPSAREQSHSMLRSRCAESHWMAVETDAMYYQSVSAW